jgi:hypothetical protein
VLEKDVSIVKEAGGIGRALVMNFKDVPVSRNLKLELIAKETDNASLLPTLAGIEIQRQD